MVEKKVRPSRLITNPTLGQTVGLTRNLEVQFDVPISTNKQFHSNWSTSTKPNATVQVNHKPGVTLEEVNQIVESEILKLRKSLTKEESRQSDEGDIYAGIAWVMAESGAAKQTIYGWVNRREIPYYKVGKNLRFKKSEILDWLLKHKKLSRDEINKNVG
ncbi:MAG: helix-turn-helix domain-containing protein [bacterium]|nr:helix-turn-helix domain-containing protein [bacterium]